MKVARRWMLLAVMTVSVCAVAALPDKCHAATSPEGNERLNGLFAKNRVAIEP